MEEPMGAVINIGIPAEDADRQGGARGRGQRKGVEIEGNGHRGGRCCC